MAGNTFENANKFCQYLSPFLKDKVEGALSKVAYFPVGSVIPYFGKTAPENFLACNGGIYNIADYPELAAFILNSYSSYNFFGGDGTTTFAVPNLNGELIRGAGTNSHTSPVPQGSGSSIGVHQNSTVVNYGWVNNATGGWSSEYPGNDTFYGVTFPSTANYDSTWTEATKRKSRMDTDTVRSTYSGTATSFTCYTNVPTCTGVLWCIAYKTIYMKANSVVYMPGRYLAGSFLNDSLLYGIHFYYPGPFVAGEEVTIGSLPANTGGFVAEGYFINDDSSFGPVGAAYPLNVMLGDPAKSVSVRIKADGSIVVSVGSAALPSACFVSVRYILCHYTGLSIVSAPRKVDYHYHDRINLTGLQIVATPTTLYGGDPVDVTSSVIALPDHGMEAGITDEIKFYYLDGVQNKLYSVTQVITILEMTGLICNYPVAELSQYSTFSLAGCVVKAVYADGSMVDVTQYATFDMAEGTPLDTLGDYTVNVTYSEGENTQTTSFTFSVIEWAVPEWATGSDDDIVKALELHYQDVIDLTQYWHVGDMRTVSLSAMASGGVANESHAPQDVTFVISEVGGVKLTTPINGHTTCAFQVDQVDCLNEPGRLASSGYNTTGWAKCRRTWCNNVYYNAVPETLRPIFKEFVNKSSYGRASSSLSTFNDYFSFRAEIEIRGSATNSVAGEGTYVTWYKIAENKVKKVNGTAASFWTRSPQKSNLYNFLYFGTAGTTGGSTPHQSNRGLAPYGCI